MGKRKRLESIVTAPIQPEQSDNVADKMCGRISSAARGRGGQNTGQRAGAREEADEAAGMECADTGQRRTKKSNRIESNQI